MAFKTIIREGQYANTKFETYLTNVVFSDPKSTITMNQND